MQQATLIPSVSLTFLEHVEYRCDHGHTIDGDSKSNTSFMAVCGGEGDFHPAPLSGCKPVVCNGVPVLPNTLPLPDGTQEMSFFLVTYLPCTLAPMVSRLPSTTSLVPRQILH